MKKLSALIVSLLIFSMLFGSVSAATLPPGLRVWKEEAAWKLISSKLQR